MKLTNNDCQSITAELDILDLSAYVIARVRVFKNCCNEVLHFKEVVDITSTISTDDIYINGNIFTLNSGFFDDELTDNVYTIEIELFEPNGTKYADTGCIFLDCDTKCKVYEKIKTLTSEEDKTQLLMEHYSLSVGSNCSCDCDKLCEIYKSLLEKLEGIESDCGCV